MVFNRSIYFPIYEWGVLWESITTSGLYYYYITSRIKARVSVRNSVLETFLGHSSIIFLTLTVFKTKQLRSVLIKLVVVDLFVGEPGYITSKIKGRVSVRNSVLEIFLWHFSIVLFQSKLP